jgi:hypothetical protein
MIRMITGFTRLPDGRIVDPGTGAFETEPEIEERLVSRGVAEEVGVPAVATPVPASKEVKASEDTPKPKKPAKAARKPAKKPPDAPVLSAEDPV